jgi:large subunit ribosomal protein L40e
VVEIFIKVGFGDRKTISMFVNFTETIREVKTFLQGTEGIPKSQQRLIFADETLEDGRTLSDYDITEGDTIHLVFLTEFHS